MIGKKKWGQIKKWRINEISTHFLLFGQNLSKHQHFSISKLDHYCRAFDFEQSWYIIHAHGMIG